MSEKSSEQYKPLTRGTVVAKRYEVEKYLGESLLGPTYVVKNRDTQKLIALKFVRPEYKAVSELDDVKALLKKARKIKHPNVVQYGNAGEDKGMIFFTQEYFPSVNLRQLMIDYKADAKEFSVNEAFQLISKILEALQVIHAQGLFHTNLKPENILIKQRTSGTDKRKTREIKITDVMSASILHDEIIEESPYRAPECRKDYQMLGAKGGHSDIFSVGNILYELLVGRTAEGTYLSPSQLRSDLNSSIDNIVDIALSTRPADRHDSPGDMLRNIELIFLDSLWEDNTQVDHRNLYRSVGVGLVLLFALALLFLLRPAEQPINPMDADNALRAEVLDKISSEYPALEKYEQLSEQYAKDYGPMIYIPSGPVVTGNFEMEFVKSLALSGDPRAEKIEELEAFYIDKYEFPNTETRSATVNVTYAKAEEVCKRAGKKLCTQYQWERACRGPNSQLYAYDYGVDKYDFETDKYNKSYCGDPREYLLGGVKVEQPFEEWIENIRDEIDPADDDMSTKILAGYLGLDSEYMTEPQAEYVAKQFALLETCLSYQDSEVNDDKSPNDGNQACSKLRKSSTGYRSNPPPIGAAKMLPKENCQSTEKVKGQGVYGLSAGPSEWTSTPSKISPDKYVVKGGDLGGAHKKIYRCSFSKIVEKNFSDGKLSFRCCKTVKSEN